MKYVTNKLKANLVIKFDCKKGEVEIVKERLLDLIIHKIKRTEGLFTSSILPWKKSYYFSVLDVKLNKRSWKK